MSKDKKLNEILEVKTGEREILAKKSGRTMGGLTIVNFSVYGSVSVPTENANYICHALLRYKDLKEENKALKTENDKLQKLANYDEKVAYKTSVKNADMIGEISSLKEKNKQLVDALEYIRERVIEKFETWADGEDVDFKTICGAVIETINNSMREYNPSHIFTPSKENNRFCDKCGKYLTDEIHQRSKNNII